MEQYAGNQNARARDYAQNKKAYVFSDL